MELNDFQKRAIEKSLKEKNKWIDILKKVCPKCENDVWYYLIYILHLIRVKTFFRDKDSKENQVFEVISDRYDDIYKYLIQCIFISKQIIPNEKSLQLIKSQELTDILKTIALHLNKSQEGISFFSLINTIEVYGERDQYAKLLFQDFKKDHHRYSIFKYAVRVHRENHSNQMGILLWNELLDKFKIEYEPYDDLFEKVYGLSVQKYVELIQYFIEKQTERLKEAEKKMPLMEDNVIDVFNDKTFNLFVDCIYFKYVDIENSFGEEGLNCVDKLTFNAKEFQFEELRYNLLSRTPLFRLNSDQFVVSPEILMDSIFVNTHYSILETSTVKDEYKSRHSNTFVDKLKQLSEENGFEYVGHELELNEGKKNLGDLDLIMKEKIGGKYLIIEAKDHALPLSVYFHDFQAIEERLEYQKKEWEEKVKKRIEHLKMNPSKYSLSSDFQYIMVSRYPEIISRFSSILVLSEMEFSEWLRHGCQQNTYDDFEKELLNNDDNDIDQLELISKKLGLGMSTSPPKET